MGHHQLGQKEVGWNHRSSHSRTTDSLWGDVDRENTNLSQARWAQIAGKMLVRHHSRPEGRQKPRGPEEVVTPLGMAAEITAGDFHLVHFLPGPVSTGPLWLTDPFQLPLSQFITSASSPSVLSASICFVLISRARPSLTEFHPKFWK